MEKGIAGGKLDLRQEEKSVVERIQDGVLGMSSGLDLDTERFVLIQRSLLEFARREFPFRVSVSKFLMGIVAVVYAQLRDGPALSPIPACLESSDPLSTLPNKVVRTRMGDGRLYHANPLIVKDISGRATPPPCISSTAPLKNFPKDKLRRSSPCE